MLGKNVGSTLSGPYRKMLKRVKRKSDFSQAFVKHRKNRVEHGDNMSPQNPKMLQDAGVKYWTHLTRGLGAFGDE